MPTFVFLKPAKPKLNLRAITQQISTNPEKSKLLSVSKVFLDQRFDGIIIYTESVFCFSAEVSDLVVKEISSCLQKIGYPETFALNISTSPFPQKDIPFPSPMKQAGTTITIVLKEQTIGLYRDHQQRVKEIDLIVKQIKHQLPQIVIDQEYDPNNEKYHLKIMNVTCSSPENLLAFKGDIVQTAINRAQLNTDYAIKEFDSDAYQKLLEARKNKLENNTATEVIEPKSKQESEEDAILYGSEVSASQNNKQESVSIPVLTQQFASTMISPTATPEQKLWQAVAADDHANLFTYIKQVSNVDAQDPVNKKTALHIAVEKNATRCVLKLIDHKASLTITDGNGKTPFDYIKQNPKMFELLQKKLKLEQPAQESSAAETPTFHPNK